MIVVEEDLFNAEAKVDELLDKLSSAIERMAKHEIASLQNQIVAAHLNVKKLKSG